MSKEGDCNMKNKIKKKSLRTFLFVLAAAGCLGAASCAKDKITFSFAVNGGAEIAAAEVKKGEGYSLPVPTREGYEFEGWYTTEDLSGDPVEKIGDAQENLTFYAKWAKVYTVTLNLNGGTLSVTSFKAKAGVNLSGLLAAYTPVKEGYVFGAWFDENDKEISKAATMPEGDLSLTAKYKVSYKVEIYRQNLTQDGYDKDEQAIEYSDYPGTTVIAEERLRGFREVKKDGENGTLAKITLTENAAENVMRLYFDRETFTVTYRVTYPDGSGTARRTADLLYGKSMKVPCDFTAQGYVLKGWSTRENGEATYLADTMKHALYGEEQAEETSDEVAPESSMNLFAVWEKGYTDMFGGGDYLYLFDKTGSDIYLCRGDKFFKGTYRASNSSFEFNGRSFNLNGKLVSDDAFAYLDDSRSGMATAFDYATGKTDDTRTITFKNDNTLEYIRTEGELNHSSEGKYLLDKDGYFVATFSDGELEGKTLTFFRGNLNSGAKVFVQRNDEEIGSMYRHIVNGSSLILSSMYADGYMQLSLNGFGIASLNAGTTENPQASQFYYKMANGEITLYNSYRLPQYTLRVFDYNGKTGWMFYNAEYDRTIEGENGATITMDGVYNLSYKNADGVITDGLYATSSSVMGTMVGMSVNDVRYSFMITSRTEEEIGSDGKTTTVTKYSFTEKPADYAEYYFLSADNSKPQPGPLFVLNDKAEGTASIYEYVSTAKSYVIASEGTYTETDGLYTYTATKSYEVTGGMGLYDVTNLKTAVLCLDTASTSYRVYYWYTTTIGEEVENYQKVYASSNAKVTLKKIGSIMVLDNDGIVTSGTYSTSTSTHVTAITNGKSTAYVKINEEKGTFEVLWTSPYSSYLVNEYGAADRTQYLTFDGTGTSAGGGASYTVITGSGEERVTTTYKGTFEQTEEGDPFNSSLYVCVFTGKTDDDKAITFRFLRVKGSSSINIYKYNEKLNGEFTSATEGNLNLDGYGLLAEYVAPNGTSVRGVYSLVRGKENLLYFYSADGDTYYFDLTEDNAFRIRGNEYGTYFFIDNQQLTGLAAEMDGYGKLSVYDVEKSTSENKIYVAENVDYTSNNGEYTFTWTYNGETKTVTGVIRGLSSGKSTIPCFVIYQSETVATTYVNPDDFSLIVLDKLGGAVKYAANGTKESGSYTMISDSLFYYTNSNGSAASVYGYDATAKTVYKCEYANEFSYYTSDLDAMLFTSYGVAAINGARYYYQRTNEGVDLYRRTNASGANEYGYEQTKNLFTFDENGDTPAQLVYDEDGKTYYKNEGWNLSFERAEATKNLYPLKFSDVGDEDGKVPVAGLQFAPTGTAEFSVSGTIWFTYHEKVQKTDDAGNPVEDENGPVYIPGKEHTVNRSCTVSRVALKDADGNPLLDSEGKQKYQMYLTFNYFRFDISVEYNGAESVNHYSVSGLNLIQSYSSFNYSFYSALASMMGSASPIANPGTLNIQIKFDEKGDEVHRHIVSAFTEASGYTDSEGNLFEIDDNYTLNNGMYTADFVAKDGKNYRLYMQQMNQYGISGYSMMITRLETLKDGNFAVTAERVVASDGGYNKGSYVSLTLAKGEGDGKTEYKADTLFRTVATEPWTYVVREYDDNKRITSTTYFEIMLTEKTAGVGETGLTFFESVKVTEKAMHTYYTESGKNDGKSFVDVGVDGVKLLALNGKGYVITECTVDESTGVYTATASSGKKFSVKVTGDTAEITEIVEENE